MKDALNVLRDSIHLVEESDPSILDDVQAPVVSLYLPVHHTEREDRRDDWDGGMFKDLMKDAERTLAESYDKKDYEGLMARMNYVLDHPDMPLWVHAGEGLGFLFSNTDAYVFNLFFAPEPMVVAADKYFIKPLLRNFQYGTSYYVLALGSDRFGFIKGDRTHVARMQLPENVMSYFSDYFANSDDTEADMEKGELGALDYITLAGHMSPYHDFMSRKEVVKEEDEKFFRIVNRAIDDMTKDDDTDIILATLPENAAIFRKISTLRKLLPQGITKDPASLTGEELLKEALGVMDGIRDANIKEMADKFAERKAYNRASDDFIEIGMALAERKVQALFMTEGKILPGGYDINTGTVTFDPDSNPKDDGYVDPASPDITDAFAQAALKQDAHIYVVSQEDMPTDSPVAAFYRY